MIYEFDTCPYSTIQDMPDERALRFLQQVRVAKIEREEAQYRFGNDGVSRAKYKHSPHFQALQAIEDECGFPERKGCDDDLDDEWVAGIIAQRHRMRKVENRVRERDYDQRELNKRIESRRERMEADFSWATEMGLRRKIEILKRK
jgi:hypothetical protein